MVSLVSLWLPILIAAVIVFVVSSLIHTVLTYHNNDFKKLPNEDQALAALRALSLPPGDYALPKPASSAELKSPEFQEKMRQGPVLFMTVFPSGPIAMGKRLLQWFAYCVVVGIFAGYVAGRTLPMGEEYLQVFRVTGTVAFLGYGLALVQNSIWFGRNWAATSKSLLDALIYGLLTAGAFGWLWP
ncbi:hypothetical protein HRbin33_01664 [bacterium HR33]|nr:hypothetical protein HRbin33_01664 [bacterium HR33]